MNTNLQQKATLIDFVQQLDAFSWYVLNHDQDGAYFSTVAEDLDRANLQEPHWQRSVRVLWNEGRNVILVGKDIDANTDPDRQPLVLMHQSAIFTR